MMGCAPSRSRAGTGSSATFSVSPAASTRPPTSTARHRGNCATTSGTGSDQGKTSGINEVGLVGTLTGQPIGGVGTTTYRPPYVPVSFGLMAGRNQGNLFEPIRTTSIHAWHVAHGAVFENVGQWKRPWYFPRDDEDMDAAVLREGRAARDNVAVMDASTLGKIGVQGPDALEVLNR